MNLINNIDKKSIKRIDYLRVKFTKKSKYHKLNLLKLGWNKKGNIDTKGIMLSKAYDHYMKECLDTYKTIFSSVTFANVDCLFEAMSEWIYTKKH